jgi:hypothetical protein
MPQESASQLGDVCCGRLFEGEISVHRKWNQTAIASITPTKLGQM